MTLLLPLLALLCLAGCVPKDETHLPLSCETDSQCPAGQACDRGDDGHGEGGAGGSPDGRCYCACAGCDGSCPCDTSCAGGSGGSGTGGSGGSGSGGSGGSSSGGSGGPGCGSGPACPALFTCTGTACVQEARCARDSACPPLLPRCDPDGRCVGCLDDAGCGAHQRCDAGLCSPLPPCAGDPCAAGAAGDSCAACSGCLSAATESCSADPCAPQAGALAGCRSSCAPACDAATCSGERAALDVCLAGCPGFLGCF